ncbi:phosphatase inhibitor-domain-containing protein [Roridomyces roridus]|uniref:Type 1 phosphatases regulator n=1 Tax=Roridomyces roridus TaxID=1738132 RepID=A0AAD7B8J7_9AGAR|nr:phosphatase inhibitor-domain-containing protein [Roridomyces roridus]
MQIDPFPFSSTPPSLTKTFMAYTSTRRRPGTSAPGDGSRTITITNAQPEEDDTGGPSNPEDPIGALHLTGGAPRRSRPRVAWDEGVVDNEGCGRKSSKICCIYHKPKRFDESSDEDSSDSDGDSDSSVDDGRARRSNNSNSNRHQHSHHHEHDHGGAGAVRDPSSSSVTELEEPSRPNAYETVPAGKKGKGKRKSG